MYANLYAEFQDLIMLIRLSAQWPFLYSSLHLTKYPYKFGGIPMISQAK